MNKKRCHTLLPLVQLLPTVAAAAAVLFALPRTVPVLAAVPEKLTTVVEQPVEAASSEAEEEALPKLPYADGVYVGSSRGYGGAVRVQVTMENGSITEVEILDASHETKQFLRRAKRLLTTVVETQSWEVDAVSEATYTSRGILGAVQNALTGEVVNNPLPPQPKVKPAPSAAAAVAAVVAAVVATRKVATPKPPPRANWKNWFPICGGCWPTKTWTQCLKSSCCASVWTMACTTCVNPPFAPPRTQHARPRKLHWRLTVMPMTNPGVWQVPRWLWVRWSVSCWRAVDCR